MIRTPQWVFFKRFSRPGRPGSAGRTLQHRDRPRARRTTSPNDPAHAHVVADLSARIDAFFACHAREQADLWRGGRPIQNSMLIDYWRGVWGDDWAPRLCLRLRASSRSRRAASPWAPTDGPHPEDGEGPPRTVHLSTYRIARTTVTNADFAAFVTATGYTTTADSHRRLSGLRSPTRKPGRPPNCRSGHPLVAPRPGRRLADPDWRRPGGPGPARRPCLPRRCARLLRLVRPPAPHRSRVGTRSPPLPCPTRTIWKGRFPNAPAGPVGPLPAQDAPTNSNGLHHCCGNVWEWTADRFTHLHGPGALTDPKGPLNGTTRVVKGGSFLCCPSYCARFRPSSRRSEHPDTTASNLSFRTAILTDPHLLWFTNIPGSSLQSAIGPSDQ